MVAILAPTAVVAGAKMFGRNATKVALLHAPLADEKDEMTLLRPF